MFSRCSVGVVSHVDVFFDVFVGRKVISTSYSSAILRVPPFLVFKVNRFIINCVKLGRWRRGGNETPTEGIS